MQNNTLIVSVIIPCFNEEGNVKHVYNKLIDTFKFYDFEIIFVDDCSNDLTLSKIKELSIKDDRVKYISFSRNFGHQNALNAGLKYAIGNCVISMDADLQHPPHIINELLSKWEEGFEIVNTIRLDNKNVSIFKRYTSNVFYTLLNYLSDLNLNKGAADFRLLDRKVVDTIKQDFNEYNLFYRGLIDWIGFRQCFVEYEPDKRFSGKSKYSFFKMIKFAITGITSFSVRPLKIAVFIGFLFTLISLLYGLYAIYQYLFNDETIKGWTSVVISVIFVGGINMLLIGIIGEYLGNIYMQVKNRPKFIISEKSITN